MAGHQAKRAVPSTACQPYCLPASRPAHLSAAHFLGALHVHGVHVILDLQAVNSRQYKECRQPWVGRSAD
jgi:hypothetical protein